MSKKSDKLNEIDEEKAYLELCQIIAEAIQTQDINLLQYRIYEWKRKYPYEKFSKNLKAKIDYLLNQYYSEVINQILKSIKQRREKKDFNQRKALIKLYKMIKETNDIKELNKKINEWKKEYPVNDFMEMYKKRVKKYTSRKYLEENAFDTNKAFYDLCHLFKANATYEELKDKVLVWEKDYSIGEQFKVDDFNKKSIEVKRMLDDEYLYSISKEDEKEDTLRRRKASVAIQAARFEEFMKVIEKGNMAKIVEWIYKNRNVEFGGFYKEQIITKTSVKFPFSKLENTTLKLNLNERGLSFCEYQTIDESRRYIITEFIKYLVKDKKLDYNTFQKEFNKSQDAKNRNISNHEMIEQDLQSSEINANPAEIENYVEQDRVIHQDEQEPTTYVIDLNIENQNNEDNKLQITELETKPVTSKDEGIDSFIIVHPDFLKVVYEKSKIAEEMTRDNIKDKDRKKTKKTVGQIEVSEEKGEVIEVNSIMDVDRIASDATQEERVPELVYSMYLDLN